MKRASGNDVGFVPQPVDGAALPVLERFSARRVPREERLWNGRQLRKRVPRKAHALYLPTRDRADPVAVVQAQNAQRVQKLVPLRNARMLASPFAFYRGSAAIMAADLAPAPVTGLAVAACGDMHLMNFGLFGSAERSLIFAINDFDEVHPGPWEWDLKRLAASAVLAARHLGGDSEDGERVARAAVAAYRRRMREYAGMGHLEVWYDQIDEHRILERVPATLRDGAARIIAKARRRGHQRTLDKLADRIDGEYRLIEDAPLIVRESALDDGTPIATALDAMLSSYLPSLTDERRHLLSRYRIVDVARKVVGVGSVGTGCWVVMLEGAGADDPLFLQVKQATASVLAQHVPTPVDVANQGQRVVIGQRMIQGSPDIFLGWGSNPRGDFYVRQLADMKGGVEFVEGDRDGLRGLDAYAGLCGWALALAHAKSGDAAMIAGYCGTSEALDDALGRFGLAYAEQVERDFERLRRAQRARRIKVEPGYAGR